MAWTMYYPFNSHKFFFFFFFWKIKVIDSSYEFFYYIYEKITWQNKLTGLEYY